MKRIALVLTLLMYAGCAPLPNEDSSPDGVARAPQIETRDVEASDRADAVELQSTTQAIQTQPWYTGENFNEAGRGVGYYWATTPGTTLNNFTLTMSSPNTEYTAHGTVQSGDNTLFITSSADWSLTFGGSTNGCVAFGCTFWICFENLSRGWGTCTQVYGQGTTSTNMELHGSTSFFSGLRLGAYETGRWTMAITTSGYLPAPIVLKDYTMVVHGSP